VDSASSLWARAFEGPVDWQTLALALLPTILVAGLLARAVRKASTRALSAILSESVAPSSPLVRGPLRLIGLAVFVLLVGLMVGPALELAGLQPRTGVRLEPLAAWAFESGLRVILIAVLAYALVRAVRLVVQRFEHEVNKGVGLDALERAKRARTLGSLIRNVAASMIVGVSVLMILRELGVDIAPVLAGAGILGLAVGFGAQTLVRDIISGFFLILEDQVRVGDVAAINGQGGLVEAINLRTIVLRDFDGVVHVFPNGAITTLANRTKDFSFYVIDVGIAYGEDPERVTQVLNEVGAGLQTDDRYGPNILAPIEVVGVDAFADSAVTLKMRIKTVPLKQWEVGRELRRRILKAFAQHGIEIPFPQRVVSVQSGQAADALSSPSAQAD
jgi:small-conductance mechanosensitive channel